MNEFACDRMRRGSGRQGTSRAEPLCAWHVVPWLGAMGCDGVQWCAMVIHYVVTCDRIGL